MSHWKPGMPSPNPSGRPRGIPDRRSRLRHTIQEGIESVIAMLQEKASEGDVQAAALLLSRGIAPLRAESDDRVQFEFDASKPMTDQLTAITQAVADGSLTLEQGEQFSRLAARLAEVRALENGSDKDIALIDAFKQMAQNLHGGNRA